MKKINKKTRSNFSAIAAINLNRLYGDLVGQQGLSQTAAGRAWTVVSWQDI